MGSLTNFYNYTSTELSAGLILFNLIFAFVLQLIIIFVYKKTRHGLSYSQSFIFTLTIVGVLAASVMMAVQNNVIGALAIFGAFTLIRFRSILKETSDLAYVFFSLVLGISVGMGHYSLALITAGFLSTVIYAFYRFGFGVISDNFDFVLILTTKKDFKLSQLMEQLAEWVQTHEVLHIKQLPEAQAEYYVSLRLKHAAEPEAIVTTAQGSSGIVQADLLTGKNTSEF